MDEDDEKEKFRMPPLGDIGTVFVALVFFVALIWMMFWHTPFATMFDKSKPQPEKAAPSEVTVDVIAKPKN
ncbi:MAG: hypothetical protein KGI68_05630 [Alphaproteobacteria bacterium]|nr:hypothetical protein [Alphaproteobacteria bacterium]MDE1986090.1 hypothetical protein [Alphaproteobacteria bacterium]MDE2264420.1 hypothetical protein [Alphaproteobacteria bacterium]MDE2499201.1 hypothetical protein [Alphaproteobacteria bacterium]